MKDKQIPNGIRMIQEYLEHENRPLPEWANVERWIDLPRFAKDEYSAFRHLLENGNDVVGFHKLVRKIDKEICGEAIVWLIESLSDDWMCHRSSLWYFRSSKDMAMFKLRFMV